MYGTDGTEAFHLFDASVDETIECPAQTMGVRRSIYPELLAFSTIIPPDVEDEDPFPVAKTLIRERGALRSTEETLVFEPPKRRSLARPLAITLSLGAVVSVPALAAATLAAAMFGAALFSSSGLVEPALAWTLDAARSRMPELIVPIERLEVFVQSEAYEWSLRARGAPTEEPAFVLPIETISGVPDIPEGGPHEVPTVSFDPAILSQPLRFAPAESGPSWMSVSRPVLHEAFPSDAALVLRFDMDEAALRWMPGRQDPWPMRQRQREPDVSPPPDRSGRVPMALREAPLVAFGGGFQSLHFPSFGARYGGRDIIPLSKGIGTVAIYRDGHVEIGPWGDLSRDGLLEARQNLPPLVHEGKIPANIAYLNAGTISAESLEENGVRTYTNVHTWRSGLGIRSDGDIVYVLAARVTPALLAATLIRAGAVEAVQLDINAAWHASPTLATPHEGDKRSSDIETEPLFTGIEDGGRRFLTGADRDFFFVISRAEAP